MSDTTDNQININGKAFNGNWKAVALAFGLIGLGFAVLVLKGVVLPLGSALISAIAG